MASPVRKFADPILFLEAKPFCAYPHMKECIGGLQLDEEKMEKLLVHLHIFEHAILAEGHKLYSAVGREIGARVLDQALGVFAEEYAKSSKGRATRS